MISRINNDCRMFIATFICGCLLTFAVFHFGRMVGRIEMIRKYDREVAEKIDQMRRVMYLDSLSVIPTERLVPQSQGVQNEEGFNQRWKGR